MLKLERNTVDLSEYPDLVVIYLGMKVHSLKGLRTLLSFGPRIKASVDAKPDGLLLHEPIIYSLLPVHAGMRQYWRDFASLDTSVDQMPHQAWWTEFLKEPGGVGFWHELYSVRGGMEAVYDDLRSGVGFSNFAKVVPARGPMFGAQARLARKDRPAPPISEEELYKQ